jgi:alanine racemase
MRLLIKEYNLIPLINSAHQYHQFQLNSPNQIFGIQLDTGMNRLGMEEVEFTSLGKEHFKCLPNYEPFGLRR